jgi:3-isopropylmalate dehydratase small subunit
MDDMVQAAEILKGRRVAPHVVLKIVPSTDDIWNTCMHEGIIDTFKEAGALVGNAGCAGCAAGQIGQNGPGEVTVSTGNRNFPGKQGKGEVYLASPATVAASAVAGVLTSAESLLEGGIVVRTEPRSVAEPAVGAKRPEVSAEEKPLVVEGRAWLVPLDNIDTDMIFHNRHLAITDIREMGQHTFGNLPGYEDFPKKVNPGDIVITGGNFGCGSSRQQAVDCFKSLGVSLIIATSFGAIYERNAINAGFPILTGEIAGIDLKDGDTVRVDLTTGEGTRVSDGAAFRISSFTEVQKGIYLRGGLL